MKVRYRTPVFYQQFKCIGGKCEDSCCENWEIDLDDASLKKYMKERGGFGKRLRENTRVKDKQFILNGTRCPFLNDDNLCDIYIKLGEECLCETCTNFPRHIEEFEDLKEVSLTMSCPEASRIMLSRNEKMTFECKEGIDEEYGLKQKVPMKSLAFWKKPHVNKLDKPLYEHLLEARELIFKILQNRNESITERAAIVLSFSSDIQSHIDQDEYWKIAEEIEKYRNPEFLEGKKKSFKQYKNRIAEKEVWLKQILNMYEGLETIKEEWTTLLLSAINIMHGSADLHSALIVAGIIGKTEGGAEDSNFLRNYELSYQEFIRYYKEKQYEYEHILVYYIFNYFLGASYDHDVYTKVKFAIVSYLVILELDIAVWLNKQKQFLYEDQVFVSHAYSKEVEHSYNNFESLQLVLSAHPILEKEAILVALLS